MTNISVKSGLLILVRVKDLTFSNSDVSFSYNQTGPSEPCPTSQRSWKKKLDGKYNLAGGGGGRGGDEGRGRGGWEGQGGGGGSVLDALLPQKVNQVMEKKLMEDSRATPTRIISTLAGFLRNAQNVEESSQSSSEAEEEPEEPHMCVCFQTIQTF